MSCNDAGHAVAALVICVLRFDARVVREREREQAMNEVPLMHGIMMYKIECHRSAPGSGRDDESF